VNWLATILAEIIRAIFHDVITTPGTITEVRDATTNAAMSTPVTDVDDLLDLYGGMRPNP